MRHDAKGLTPISDGDDERGYEISRGNVDRLQCRRQTV